MKYIKVEWPEIQDYMLNPRYSEEVSYDPQKNCWFVPEDMEEYKTNLENDFSGINVKPII